MSIQTKIIQRNKCLYKTQKNNVAPYKMFRGWELCVLHALSVSRVRDTLTTNNSAGCVVETNTHYKTGDGAPDWAASLVAGLAERRLCLYNLHVHFCLLHSDWSVWSSATYMHLQMRY
jgi:hypothetical protein